MACRLATQSCVAFCGGRIVGTGNITSKDNDLDENRLSRTEGCRKGSKIQPCKNLFTSSVHQTWTHKNFIMTTDQNSTGFIYFKTKFLRINGAKIKESIIVGPQIMEFIQDENLKTSYVKWKEQN